MKYYNTPEDVIMGAAPHSSDYIPEYTGNLVLRLEVEDYDIEDDFHICEVWQMVDGFAFVVYCGDNTWRGATDIETKAVLVILGDVLWETIE